MAQAQTKAPAQRQDRFLEFTISGSYYNSKKETIDFEKVKGRIPFCDEDNGVGSMHVRGRFAAKWIKDTVDNLGISRYQDRIEKMRQVFVDDVQPVYGELSFVGKDIKELSIEEMQELAVAKDLRFVPLPNSGLSKRDMLIRTYVAYSEKVLLKKIKYQEESFNFAKLPSIILDGQLRQEKSEKITNEEIIAREQEPTRSVLGGRDDPKARFSMAELLQVAEQKKIAVLEGTTHEELYAQLFPST